MHIPLITADTAGTSGLDNDWRSAHAYIPMQPADRDERGDHHWADSAAAALDSTPADYPDPTSPITSLTPLRKARSKAKSKNALLAAIGITAVLSAALLILAAASTTY